MIRILFLMIVCFGAMVGGQKAIGAALNSSPTVRISLVGHGGELDRILRMLIGRPASSAPGRAG